MGCASRTDSIHLDLKCKSTRDQTFEEEGETGMGGGGGC